MALIVRYGTMKYDPNVVAVIGAGDYSDRQRFYDDVAKINRQYRKKDFVNPENYRFGALRSSRLFTDSKKPTEVFAQFAELNLREFNGSAIGNCLLLEERLVKKFKDSAKRHLVVKDVDSIVEVLPSNHYFWDRAGRDYEIGSYLDGSFDEFVLGKK